MIHCNKELAIDVTLRLVWLIGSRKERRTKEGGTENGSSFLCIKDPSWQRVLFSIKYALCVSSAKISCPTDTSFVYMLF